MAIQGGTTHEFRAGQVSLELHTRTTLTGGTTHQFRGKGTPDTGATGNLGTAFAAPNRENYFWNNPSFDVTALSGSGTRYFRNLTILRLGSGVYVDLIVSPLATGAEERANLRPEWENNSEAIIISDGVRELRLPGPGAGVTRFYRWRVSGAWSRTSEFLRNVDVNNLTITLGLPGTGESYPRLELHQAVTLQGGTTHDFRASEVDLHLSIFESIKGGTTHDFRSGFPRIFISGGPATVVTFETTLTHELTMAGDPIVTQDTEFATSLDHMLDMEGDPIIVEAEAVLVTTELTHALDMTGDPVIFDPDFSQFGYQINLSDIFRNARGYRLETDPDESHDTVVGEIRGQYLYVRPIEKKDGANEMTVYGEGLDDSVSSRVSITVDDSASIPDPEPVKGANDIFATDMPEAMGVADYALLPLYDYISNAVEISINVPRGSAYDAPLFPFHNDVRITRMEPQPGFSRATVVVTSLTGNEFSRTIELNRQSNRIPVPNQNMKAGDRVTIDTDAHFSSTERLCVYSDPYYVECYINDDNDIVLEAIRPTVNIPVFIEAFAPNPYDVIPVEFSNPSSFFVTITGDPLITDDTPVERRKVTAGSVQGDLTEWQPVTLRAGTAFETEPGRFFDFNAGGGFRSIDFLTPEASELEFRIINPEHAADFYKTDREQAYGSRRIEARFDSSFTEERTGKVFGCQIRAYTGRNFTGKFVDSDQFPVYVDTPGVVTVNAPALNPQDTRLQAYLSDEDGIISVESVTWTLPDGTTVTRFARDSRGTGGPYERPQAPGEWASVRRNNPETGTYTVVFNYTDELGPGKIATGTIERT